VGLSAANVELEVLESFMTDKGLTESEEVLDTSEQSSHLSGFRP